MDESANAYQAHNDPVDPGSDDGEVLDYDDDEENDTFSSYVALDDVTVFEAAELDAIDLLADTWDNDLDPEVSAQLIQANVQAYLSFGKEKGKGKGKGKSKGRHPVRPSHLSLEDCRRRLRELKAKTECRACGRKGHLAHDRESAMTPSSSSSQNQARAAYMVGQKNVPLPTESARQTPLKPIASAACAAVDTKKGGIFDGHTMDDNDGPWSSETDHRTSWNKVFKSGTYRGMLHGSALRDYQKQVVSLAKAKSVPANMREFLSGAQRHCRIDVTASTLQRKTGESTSVGPCPGSCNDFTHKGSNTRFIRVTCKVFGTVLSAERHPPWQDPASCSHRHTDHK